MKYITAKGITFLSLVKGDLTLDPITATQQAIASFFQFASTPVGQAILEDIRKIDQALFSKIGDLFNKLHDHVVKG